MSRKGKCGDNATMESFFHSMKVERVHHCDYQSHDKAKRDLFDYIKVFYNRQRQHSHIGYKTPAEAEAFAA
jgi:putative transposase